MTLKISNDLQKSEAGVMRFRRAVGRVWKVKGSQALGLELRGTLLGTRNLATVPHSSHYLPHV